MKSNNCNQGLSREYAEEDTSLPAYLAASAICLRSCSLPRCCPEDTVPALTSSKMCASRCCAITVKTAPCTHTQTKPVRMKARTGSTHAKSAHFHHDKWTTSLAVTVRSSTLNCSASNFLKECGCARMGVRVIGKVTQCKVSLDKETCCCMGLPRLHSIGWIHMDTNAVHMHCIITIL